MNSLITELQDIPLLLCGLFYAVLCIFSLVTGVIYMSGKRKLNPLELSEGFLEKFSSPEEERKFTRKMGLVTFIVGIVQGVTSYSLLMGNRPVHYWIALGFTIFSICSVVLKLKGKINTFPLVKLICYTAILAVLLQTTTRAHFF